MPWMRALFVVVFTVSCSQAAGWPQWLGPDRDGTTSEKVMPWKGKPEVLWRKKVGAGHSSPVVVGGKVFLHTKVNARDAEQITAYDARTGKPLWNKQYKREPFFSPFGLGPQSTPAVMKGRLYSYGVTGILSCWNANDGALHWRIDTRKQFKAPKLFFGVACSPLVQEGKVLVNVGGKNSSVVAFGTEKGKVLWRKLDAPASYSSPIVFGKGKKRQVVFLTQKGLASLSPDDGTVFWQVPFADKLDENSTTPVRTGGLLIAGSVKSGSIGLALQTNKPTPGVKPKWMNRALTCYFSTPIPVGKKHLYMVTGKPVILGAEATLHCVEADTGKVVWNKRRVGQYHAAITHTGNNKLLMLTDTGYLILMEPNTTRYQELARSKVCGRAWAHPALANGLLYIRDDNELICLKLPS